MAKWLIECNYCGKEFLRELKHIKSNEKRELPNYCSRSCSAKASWENGNLDHLRTGRSPESQATIDNRKALQKNWYQDHKEEIAKKHKRQKQELKAWVNSKKIKCKICGEDRKPCLVFHHRNSANKNNNIGSMVASRATRQAIQEEIDKCDVLCANCHRWLHHKEK